MDKISTDFKTYLKDKSNLSNIYDSFLSSENNTSNLLNNLKILIKLYYELKVINENPQFLLFIQKKIESQLKLTNSQIQIIEELSIDLLFVYFNEYIIKYLLLQNEKTPHMYEIKQPIQLQQLQKLQKLRPLEPVMKDVPETSESVINILLYMLFIIFTKDKLNEFYIFIFDRSRHLLITKYPTQVLELLNYVVSHSYNYIEDLLIVLNHKDMKVDSKLSTSESKQDELKITLEQLNKEKKELEKKKKELEDKLSILISVKKSTDEKIKKLQINEQDYQEKMKRKAEINKLITSAELEIKKIESELSTHESEIKTNNELLIKLNKKKTDLEQLKITLDSTIKEIKSKQQINKTELEEIDDILKSLELEIQKLKSDVDVIRRKKLAESNDEKELTKLEQREKELTIQIKKLNDELRKSDIVKQLSTESKISRTQLQAYKEYLKNSITKTDTEKKDSDKKTDISDTSDISDNYVLQTDKPKPKPQIKLLKLISDQFTNRVPKPIKDKVSAFGTPALSKKNTI